MPVVASSRVCTDLIIPSSPPQPLRKGISVSSSEEDEHGDDESSNNNKNLFLIPIELLNGCTEVNCTIESDNVHLTNLLRKYYLEHFGHRNLNAMVEDYTHDAILVAVINGQRTSYHGKDDIRTNFFQNVFFKLHPTINSTFELKHIEITSHNGSCNSMNGGSSMHAEKNKNCSTGMGIWSAKTPIPVEQFLFDPTIGKHD